MSSPDDLYVFAQEDDCHNQQIDQDNRGQQENGHEPQIKKDQLDSAPLFVSKPAFFDFPCFRGYCFPGPCITGVLARLGRLPQVSAALGGQFEVATLDGAKSRVKVPDGTQTGKQFRLKGKGMPVMRSTNYGDLYIQVVTETPQNLTRRQRELLEEFEQISSKENNPESHGFFSKMKSFLDGLTD